MKKVMLVEDEELILQGIRNIVDWEALGLSVVHMAHDGVEALEMWEREPVHIVVTDISMPEMDGLTLLRKIREKEEQVRFIILTGYDEFAYAREAVRLDVENYILKPIDEEELQRQLRETVMKLESMDKKKVNSPKHSGCISSTEAPKALKPEDLRRCWGLRRRAGITARP